MRQEVPSQMIYVRYIARPFSAGGREVENLVGWWAFGAGNYPEFIGGSRDEPPGEDVFGGVPVTYLEPLE